METDHGFINATCKLFKEIVKMIIVSTSESFITWRRSGGKRLTVDERGNIREWSFGFATYCASKPTNTMWHSSSHLAVLERDGGDE